MAFNVPSYDADLLSFGPGIVYMGTAGACPWGISAQSTADIGAVDEGMVLTHATEVLDVNQGNPRQLIKSFRTSETVTFAFTGFEWLAANMDDYLGAGHVSGNNFSYGGDVSFNEVSLRLQHAAPPQAGATVGATIIIDIWEARADGNLALTFGADLHGFPVTFTALQASTDWLLAPLAAGYQYYKMQIIPAP